MAYGRNKFATQEHSMSPASVAHVLRDMKKSRLPDDELRELENLRAINAHLLGELSALRQREAAAQQLADRDALTGLYNRRRMLELLGSAIEDANEQRLSVGLLFIDLNVAQTCGSVGSISVHGFPALPAAPPAPRVRLSGQRRFRATAIAPFPVAALW